MTETVDALIDILRPSGNRGLPLSVVQSRLEERLRADGHADPSTLAGQAIDSALDNWTAEKIIDLPAPEDGVPDEGEVWFLRVLDPEESEALRRLPEAKQAVLRMLWKRDLRDRLGALPTEIVSTELQMRGIEPHGLPTVADRVQGYMTVDGDGALEYWFGLIPRYTRTEEFRRALEENCEAAFKRHTWQEKAATHDTAYERRKAARKKKPE
jgi:hypothetical protein